MIFVRITEIFKSIKKISFSVMQHITSMHLAGYRNSYPAGDGFGDSSFFGLQNNIPDELMPSTMRSAAVKKKYSSVLHLLRHCLPVFDEVCGTVMNFVFFGRVALIKIANTSQEE